MTLLGLVMCFAIPEIHLIAIPALLLMIFGALCLPPVRRSLSFLRSKGLYAATLAGLGVVAIGTFVAFGQPEDYRLSTNTDIAAKECYLATLHLSLKGKTPSFDGLVEANQYPFAALSEEKVKGKILDKVADETDPGKLDMQKILDSSAAIVQQCHARFANTGNSRLVLPQSNFKTMVLCRDFPLFFAAETDEIGVLPEDLDKVKKVKALHDKIQPKIKADMDFEGGNVWVDKGETLFDDPDMPDTLIRDVSLNSNFVTLVNTCLDRFSNVHETVFDHGESDDAANASAPATKDAVPAAQDAAPVKTPAPAKTHHHRGKKPAQTTSNWSFT